MLFTRANTWGLFPTQAHSSLRFWGSRDPLPGNCPTRCSPAPGPHPDPPFQPKNCCNGSGRKVQQKAAEATPGTGEDGQFCEKLGPVCSEVRFWGPVPPSADTVGTQRRATLVANPGRNILNATAGERPEAGGALGWSWTGSPAHRATHHPTVRWRGKPKIQRDEAAAHHGLWVRREGQR